MTFKHLSNYFQKLEETTSRLKITEILANLFKEADADEIDKIVYLAAGRLLPAYEGLEFQMAEKTMIRAIAGAAGVEDRDVQKIYKELGDLGNAAEYLKKKSGGGKLQKTFFEKERKEKEESVVEVYYRLTEIAKESGEGSVERKIGKMSVLLEDLDPLSVRFVVRIPLGRLRLGFSELTILDALSWMIAGNKSLRGELEDAYNVLADAGEIAKKIKEGGIAAIKKIKPKAGIPILPALAQRLGTVEEMIEKMGEVAVEPKYDGERLQLHIKDGEVRLFTRNLENVTHMFPEIVEALKKEIRVKEAIFDSEGVGVDPKTGRFIPFQKTMTRKRKHGVKEAAMAIPFKCFIFDILLKDGVGLIEKPLLERRKILEKVLSEKSEVLVLTPQIVTNDPEMVRRFHDEQIKKGLEGAMVKKTSAPYRPGRREFTWVKFKQEKTKKGGGLADTIDAVVMGTTRGKGKRVEFGVGTFLVGIRKGSKIVTISSIGTGLSDEQWREMYERTQKYKTKEKPEIYDVNKDQFPDTWIRPKVVVEIQADNITESPKNTSGYGLRFPRLIRFRDDKDVSQITTFEEFKHLYDLQFGYSKT